MSLIAIPWRPTDRQLRQFAATLIVALPLLGWLATRHLTATAVMAALGALAVVVGMLRPQALRVPFVGLCLATAPLGFVVSEAVLLAIWLLVMTPIGLVLRLLGRDAMHRRFDRQAKSYYAPKAQAGSPRDYFRQS